MQRVHLIPEEVAHIVAFTAWLVDMPDFTCDDPEHPVMLARALHSADALHQAAKAIEANFNGPGFCWIAGLVDGPTADILRIVVERSDYAAQVGLMGAPNAADLAEDAEIALRSLAFKLSELGIETSRPAHPGEIQLQ